MHRIVLDTNIYISAFTFKNGIPRKIFEMGDQDVFQLLISKAIIGEIRGVLRVKFEYELSQLELLENLLLASCELVEPRKRIYILKTDPDDNKILECAIEGKADFIVSGDKHLLNLKEYEGIKIFNARNFLERYLKK